MPASASSHATSQSFVNTPDSSPPPADVETMAESGISEAMRHEEEKMQQKTKQDQARRDEEMAKERQKDVEGGEEVVDKKFKSLEYLLKKSKVLKTWYFTVSIDPC
jgi:ATP-dependent DNA helicase